MVIYSDLVDTINTEGIAETSANVLGSFYDLEPERVRHYIRELEAAGWVRVVKEEGKQGHSYIPLLSPSQADNVKEVERKPKEPTKPTLYYLIGDSHFIEFVERFWSYYPKRNGIHKDKQKAVDELKKLRPEEIEDILKGAYLYGQSKTATDGYAKDAFRWLRNKGWLDWQGVETVPVATGRKATL